jgi:hypothetical protein
MRYAKAWEEFCFRGCYDTLFIDVPNVERFVFGNDEFMSVQKA